MRLCGKNCSLILLWLLDFEGRGWVGHLSQKWEAVRQRCVVRQKVIPAQARVQTKKFDLWGYVILQGIADSDAPLSQKRSNARKKLTLLCPLEKQEISLPCENRSKTPLWERWGIQKTESKKPTSPTLLFL